MLFRVAITILSENYQKHIYALSYDASIFFFPKRVLQWVHSDAFCFNFQNILVSLTSSSSCLRLLVRLPVTSLLAVFPSITRFRRQFLCKMWPTQLAFLHFTVCMIFALSFIPWNAASFLTRSVKLIFRCPTYNFLLYKVALLLPSHKFPVSYFKSKTACPKYVVVFLSVFSQTEDMTSQSATTTSSHAIFNSLQPLQALYSRLCYRPRPTPPKQTNKPEHSAITSNYKILPLSSLQFIDHINSETTPAQILKWLVEERGAVLCSTVPFIRPWYEAYHMLVSATQVKNEWSLTCGVATPT